MFNLNRSSLDFLLEQIRIGLNYPGASADPNDPQLANVLDPRGVREVAGTNNNLVGGHYDANGVWVPGPNGLWGASDQPFLRLSQTSYNSAPVVAAGYDNVGASVTDANARTISSLVSTADATNPAYVEALAASPNGGYVDGNGDPYIANAGVLAGGKYNAFFVAFGQFFDHGLDFIQKGGNGVITIPIPEGDPLYIDPSDPEYIPGVSNVMRISRATLANPPEDFYLANPDADYVGGINTGNVGDLLVGATPLFYLNDGVTPIYNNNTALLIDQSQTYGSAPSVNAFLREYTDAGVVTGRVVAGDTNGANSGLATWADIKANAARIGIELTDTDVSNAPMLRVDAAGTLLFTPDGTLWTTAQYTGALIDSDPFMRDADGNVLRTNQAFILDINPAADPNFLFDGPAYDAALLDAHFVAGDGRANENYQVTSVHHVFHEEHNYQVENVKQNILDQNDLAFLNEWLLTDVTAVPTDAAGIAALEWDGNALFQAARLITESEYNHIAIDQYVGGLYGALPEFVSYSSDINMNVSLEFAQSVFRLGHSMLNNTIDIVDPLSDLNNPTILQTIGLMDGALDPVGFATTGSAAITLGLVLLTGEEVDEFLAPSVQNGLNGQVLDLGAIDIARGRDVGLPTHNELRQQIYNGLLQHTNNTNGGALAPYDSWADYGGHLRNEATLVNLIAGYARGGDVYGDAIVAARAAYEAGAGTLNDIRAAAQAVLTDYGNGVPAAVQFMQGAPTFDPATGTWTVQGGNQGFWDVDLFIGGLAERPLFDGPLGTTFSYIILDFAQRLQDGDRFYYLYRTPMGTELGDEIIRNQFADLVMRANGLEHLNGDVFIAADKYFILDGFTPNGVEQLTDVDANNDINDYFNAYFAKLDDGSPASSGHIVIAGNSGNDYIIAGDGDDTVYGDDGNDIIQGSQGNDHLYGGAGNDYITDDENDDFIDGGAGDDVIFAGPGVLDTVFGGEGNDEIHGGDGIDELIGGAGDDLLYGDGDTDVLFGGDGNDYMEGGDSVDEMWGGDGNDWIRGGVGDDHLNGMGGNDLLEGGVGAAANDGDRLIGEGGVDFGIAPAVDTGFDIASYERVGFGIIANLHTSNENGTGALLDTYVGIDGLVGTGSNDILIGAGPDTISTNGFNNLLVGGAGDDVLEGLGGDDVLIGDSVFVTNDLSVVFDPDTLGYTLIPNWKGTGEDRPDFGVNGGLGHILGDNGADGAADRVVFSGNRNDYIITLVAAGVFSVVDTRGIDSTEAGDLVMGVELFEFADITLDVNQLINFAPAGAVTITGWASAGQPAASPYILTANIDGVTDGNGINLASRTFQWQVSLDGGATWANIGGAIGQTYAPTADMEGRLLRVVYSYTDGAGNAESVTSAATEQVGEYWSGNNNNNGHQGTDGQDVLLGNGGNDTLHGWGGSDLIDGGDGNDRFIAHVGDGNDIYIGGAGTDTLLLNQTNADANVNLDSVDWMVNGQTLSALTATSAEIGTDSLSGIENVIGSNGDNILIGDSGANDLRGRGGNDTLIGGAGADTLIGGGGNDTFIATIGDGNDSYTGNGGVDTYDLSQTSAEAIISLAAGFATGTDIGLDTLASIENVIGNDAANTITGNGAANLLSGLGGNDVIFAGGGADTIIGGAGDDIMNGQGGADTFVFVAGFGHDMILGFDANPAGGQDILDVTSYGFDAAGFAANVVIQNSGSDTLIVIGDDTILLSGVAVGVVTETDFHWF